MHKHCHLYQQEQQMLPDLETLGENAVFLLLVPLLLGDLDFTVCVLDGGHDAAANPSRDTPLMGVPAFTTYHKTQNDDKWRSCKIVLQTDNLHKEITLTCIWSWARHAPHVPCCSC